MEDCRAAPCTLVKAIVEAFAIDLSTVLLDLVDNGANAAAHTVIEHIIADAEVAVEALGSFLGVAKDKLAHLALKPHPLALIQLALGEESCRATQL